MLCFILVMIPSNAQLVEKLSIHGFGGWAYGKTDGNKYLVGNKDGSFRNAQFALNITARPYDKLTINTQLYTESGLDKDNVELDYAFIEWTFSDALKLRMGKVKCPFGIYSEIFDVGTFRPFYELPQAIYGEKGVTTKSYYGAGLTGNFSLTNDWSIQYDLYGGELVFQHYTNLAVIPIPYDPYLMELLMDITTYEEDMYGARLDVYAPVEGLYFGAAYFSGNPQFFINGELNESFIKPGRFFNWNLHAEYLTDTLSLRSEYLYVGRRHEKDVTQEGFYVETAYKFLDNWQIAFQYNRLRLNLSAVSLEKGEGEKHDEIAFGLNYWISTDLVLKCSYHVVNGAYLPTIENLLETVLTGGSLNDKTHLFIFSTQFSF